MRFILNGLKFAAVRVLLLVLFFAAILLIWGR